MGLETFANGCFYQYDSLKFMYGKFYWIEHVFLPEELTLF